MNDNRKKLESILSFFNKTYCSFLIVFLLILLDDETEDTANKSDYKSEWDKLGVCKHMKT